MPLLSPSPLLVARARCPTRAELPVDFGVPKLWISVWTHEVHGWVCTLMGTQRSCILHGARGQVPIDELFDMWFERRRSGRENRLDSASTVA